MLVSETSIEKALSVFLKEARIPRAGEVTAKMDAAWMNLRLVPAFLKALEEIEEVDYGYGFDASKIDVIAYRKSLLVSR